MDHNRAPLWEALQKHHSYTQANFHVPGHKAGQAFDQEGSLYFSSVLPFDLTEVGDLDDLHDPIGAIKEAQALAADAFGAGQTRFLVGGTTAGVLASILSICRPKDKIIVARHCHQSVFHGCFLAGATVIPIPYAVDPSSGLELPISPEDIDRLLIKHPEAKAVILTSPTYFGVVQRVREISKIVHRYQIPLIVDEAHGAHFGFHPQLPIPAIRDGADISIQSTHKMLPAMTMSSMLHAKEWIDMNQVDLYLKMIQSSSPSYPLMASLDLARRYMMTEGERQLSLVMERIHFFRKKLEKIKAVKEIKRQSTMDPFRLTIESSYYTGYKLAEALESKGVYAELSDERKVLLVFSVGTQLAELDILYQTLMDLHVDKQVAKSKNKPMLLIPREGEIIPYAECRTRERCFIPVKHAIGKRSATHLVPYPPGIPLVLMGERIHQEVIDYLLFLLTLGGKVRGLIEYQGDYWLYVYQEIE
jgi:arginine/lysine/ornithine decarboxylase